MKQFLDLASLLIAHDVLSRERTAGPPPPGGRTVADLSVSEMIDRVQRSTTIERTDQLHSGARAVVRSGSELGQYSELTLQPAVDSDTAPQYAQLALDNGLMPSGYDQIDLTAPQYQHLKLKPEDLMDPGNDYVQRRAADGYDDASSALRRAATGLAENQGSRASLAQSLDRGAVTSALEGVATLRGEVDMELSEAADIVERVAGTASKDAIGRLLDGDASDVEDDVKRAATAENEPGGRRGEGEHGEGEHNAHHGV